MALDFVAGCFGGCAGIFVGHPLDTVKIRIQTQDFRNPQYKGSIDCFRSILRQESFAGLYKGITSPLAGVAVINAIIFGVYGNIQKNIPDPDSLSSHFLSGSIAGIVQSFICSPMELIKTRMQIQKQKVSIGPIQYLAHIYKTERLSGVFKGLNITFLRESLAFGIYFSSYEWLTRNESSSPISTPHLLAAGGAAGAFSWLFTYPIDVIKSRLQADGVNGEKLYKNSIDCLRKSIKSEGGQFLVRGLSPTLMRAFPTNAATWMVVTWIMQMANTSDSSKVHHHRPPIMAMSVWDEFPASAIHSYDFCFVYKFYLKYLGDES